MSFDTIIQHTTTVSILFFLYLLFHSKIKRQTLKESWTETLDFLKGIIEQNEEGEL